MGGLVSFESHYLYRRFAFGYIDKNKNLEKNDDDSYFQEVATYSSDPLHPMKFLSTCAA